MSSKINLQTCEYACKSSIFQDNQLIFINFVQLFLVLLCIFVSFCLYLSFLHIYILHLVRKYFPVSETKLFSKALSPAKAHSRASGACLATAGVKRRLLAPSALYAAVRILVERFLRYRKAISRNKKKQMTDTVSSVICFVFIQTSLLSPCC